jgi:hypothetical protein
MQKVVTFGALTALFFLATPATRAQNADEVERLRRENELLKKENELLKKEIELLKKQAKAKPDGVRGPKASAKSITKARVGDVEYQLVKCVRDPRERTRVTFTFAARCAAEDGRTIGIVRRLNLTTGGGKALKDGKVVDGPPPVRLTKGVWSKFQTTYAEVDEDITEFDEVELVMGGRFAIKEWKAKFHAITIQAKLGSRQPNKPLVRHEVCDLEGCEVISIPISIE